MTKRSIKNIEDLTFEPFDNYGEPVKGMSWHKISYDKSNGGFGTYILKMDAGAKSLNHIHQGYEEFYVIDGELEAVRPRRRGRGRVCFMRVRQQSLLAERPSKGLSEDLREAAGELQEVQIC